MRIFRKLSILAILVLFITCQKNIGNDKEMESQLFMVYEHSPGSDGVHDSCFYRLFEYNENKQITTIKDSIPLTGTGITVLTYDNAGRLIVARSENNYSTFIDSFFYEQTEQLSSVVERNVLHDPVSNYSFRYFAIRILGYDAIGRMVGDTVHDQLTNAISYTKFTYDENDDIIEWKYFSSRAGILDSSGVNLASYMSGENQYRFLGATYYFLRGDPIALSKHAPKSLVPCWGSPVAYTYRFDALGRVTKIILDRPYATPTVYEYDLLYR